MQNIGLLFIKMGQYNDACTSFEFVMQEKPDFKTGKSISNWFKFIALPFFLKRKRQTFKGLHMVLSYYALADRENMRKSFLRLLDVRAESDDFDKLVPEVNKMLCLILNLNNLVCSVLLFCLFFFFPLSRINDVCTG
jgi:intraflagellar transport protein 88